MIMSNISSVREVIVFSRFSKHLRDSHFTQYSTSAGVVDFLSNETFLKSKKNCLYS